MPDSEPQSVSVIMPAYNAAGTIARALASVAGQTVKPAEVIVVDDGSKDGTAVEARKCESMFSQSRLIVVEQPNRGAGAARNRAIAEAHSSYLAFLDADDEWLPRKLEVSLDRISGRLLILVAHNGLLVDNGTRKTVDIALRYRTAAVDPLHGLYRRGFISTSSVVARREAVVAAGGFDESLRTGQDFDLWLKMLCAPGTPFEVFEDELTLYHVSPSGITANTTQRLEDTLVIAVKHAPRLHRYTGRFFASLWFRIIAVHAEAGMALYRSGRFVAAACAIGALPFRLALLSSRAVSLIARELPGA
jgi:teichuronic acid biosynthesis glycosyltransferase TuaG